MNNATDPSRDAALLTVQRGLQVLRAFRCERGALGNAELVRRTGLPKATVSRLTSTLLQLGFLRPAPGGREFELATGPLGIGHAYVAASEVVRVADPHLQRLADALDVSVSLAVGDGLEMIYIAYKAGRRVGTLRMGVGSVLPMGTTAIGRAYLSGVPEERRTALIAALRAQAGRQADALEEGIRRSFADFNATGTCAVLGGYRHGAWGVARPVTVGRERVVMVLSCGRADIRPDLTAERKRIEPVLKPAARALELALADVEFYR